jgi:glycosyltransferase involved in cell wall biosynthesis
MDASVIIPTWNNSRSLARTLESLEQCVIPEDVRWEVVVVNNNCTDDTDAAVGAFAGRLPIVYVREPVSGVSSARNAGLDASSGRLIVFADDDMKMSPEWLASYWSAYLQHSEGFYFGGPVMSVFEGTKPDAELLQLAPASVRGLDLGPEPTRVDPPRFFLGGNWACPARALRQIGGFDVSKGLNPSTGKVIVGSETAAMKRLNGMGWAGWYVPMARITQVIPPEKCTLKHAAARAEAHRFDQIVDASDDEDQGPIILGAPRWVYRAAASDWMKWLLARARGKPGYREYVEFRKKVGTIRGFRARKSAPK